MKTISPKSFRWLALVGVTAFFAVTAFCGEDVPFLLRTRPLRRPADGYGDVRTVAYRMLGGKEKEAREFVEQLRARPTEGRTLEERQSVDMAEYALLRGDLAHSRARAVECLRSVYDMCPTSFWGWASYTFLKDLGEKVAEPPRDPLRGLGSLADGVVNLEPRQLAYNAKATAPTALETEQPSAKLDLSPGSRDRRAILRNRLVAICGTERIAALRGAAGGEALFNRLWKDDAMLEDFLLSGPVFHGPTALETLMTLLLNDEKEGWAKTPMGRRATVAVAINAMAGDNMKATVRHWAAFRRLGMLNRFVKSTKDRDCRQWRFIVRRPIDPADILYLNTTHCYPARLRRNVGILGVPYRKKNCFGVSKWAKQDEFLRPWLASGWPRQYLRSRVGGVCTEQALWAALCANAHGIMSERAGQPGHCCWLLNENGNNWVMVNSIRPYTQGVFKLWGHGFQYIQSVERAFADRTAHDESELLLFAGKVREAAMRCPYNYTAWRAYTDSLKKSGAGAAEWRNYLLELLAKTPDGRLVSWDFAWEAIEEMAAKGMDERSLAKETARVFKGLPQPKTRISEEMNYRHTALGRFLKRFAKNDELTAKILSVALAANRESPAYLPQIFAYALGRWSNDKAKLGQFLALASKMSDSSDEGADSSLNWRMIFRIKGCCDDRAIFRMMAAFRDKDDPPRGTAQVLRSDYGQPLASGDALVKTSSSGREDAVEDHARVSDATPYDPKRAGLFVTKDESSPWVVVELAGDVTVSGVTVIGDARGLVAWVSQDGTDWQEVASTGGGETRWQIDLRAKSPVAKFVKIGRVGDEKKPLRLNKVLVYGRRLF